ncbi:hypothetical protein [Mariniflexile sp. HMF6888]|uniref:hypothetical protein n=1 Tax=Mariniflexile sp. HMF6888 TaxID=3373086 RepID=UPI00379B1573
MKKIISTKKILGIVAGSLLAFALFFNTSLESSENGDISFSLASLENAQALSEDICQVEVCIIETTCWDEPPIYNLCEEKEYCFLEDC